MTFTIFLVGSVPDQSRFQLKPRVDHLTKVLPSIPVVSKLDQGKLAIGPRTIAADQDDYFPVSDNLTKVSCD